MFFTILIIVMFTLCLLIVFSLFIMLYVYYYHFFGEIWCNPHSDGIIGMRVLRDSNDGQIMLIVYIVLYTSLFQQRNGCSKHTYNIINKENTISKY